MRRLVPQSLASSSSAISCRWNTATWAERRLTLPLGVRSKSSPWLAVCATFSLTCSLAFSFSLASLSFSLEWPDGAFSSGLGSLWPNDGDSSETTWGSSRTPLWVGNGETVASYDSKTSQNACKHWGKGFHDDLTLSFPVLLLVSVIRSLPLLLVVVMVEEWSVRTW